MSFRSHRGYCSRDRHDAMRSNTRIFDELTLSARSVDMDGRLIILARCCVCGLALIRPPEDSRDDDATPVATKQANGAARPKGWP